LKNLDILRLSAGDLSSLRPKIKPCLFPLSDRNPKKFIASFDEKLWFFKKNIFFIRVIHEFGE
jgi:hypothetical protein